MYVSIWCLFEGNRHKNSLPWLTFWNRRVISINWLINSRFYDLACLLGTVQSHHVCISSEPSSSFVVFLTTLQLCILHQWGVLIKTVFKWIRGKIAFCLFFSFNQACFLNQYFHLTFYQTIIDPCKRSCFKLIVVE